VKAKKERSLDSVLPRLPRGMKWALAKDWCGGGPIGPKDSVLLRFEKADYTREGSKDRWDPVAMVLEMDDGAWEAMVRVLLGDSPKGIFDSRRLAGEWVAETEQKLYEKVWADR
jgi:hypothetical protein